MSPQNEVPRLRAFNHEASVPIIVPNRWQGEANCVVGPFSSKTVAEYFANHVVDFGHYERFSQRVVVKRDAYYVEVIEA